jgi:4-amino-4-deoxy-L-arabinose transferase-like glycosyltransferase
MRRDLAWLFVAALAVRAGAALLVPSPPYTDPAYYTMVAGQLAAGHGLSAPALWSFLEVGGRLPANPGLPVPSNGHWMPLTSLVAAPFVAVLGDWLGAWRAAQIPMVLLGAALVPFTYLVGWELWSSRRVALGGALLMLLGGPLLVYFPMVDNFAVFGACGGVAIWSSVRAMRASRPGWWLVLAGAACGLATLARVDGLLLLVAPGTAWLLHADWAPLRRRLGWGLASAAAFGLVLAPWLVRQVVVLGSPFPSAGGHTLWITTYNDQFSLSANVSLAHYLDWGWGNIIGSKLAAWGELVGRTAVLLGGLFVLPFAYGLWAERRRRELAPFLVYFVAMFVVMGAVFTFHAPKGAFYHSAAAWLPFALPLAVASLPAASTAAGRAWPFLRRTATHRFLLVAGLAGALALSVIGSGVLVSSWSIIDRRVQSAARFLATQHAGDVVMAYDPSALYLASGDPGVAPSFDPFDVVDRVVDAYHVRWVVVILGPGETRDPLGLWDGAAATDVGGAHPAFLPAAPAFEADGVRIYPVTSSR